MIRTLAATLVTLVIIGGLALPVRADTVDVSGTITVTDTIGTEVSSGVYNYTGVGSGVDSVYGDFSFPTAGTLDFNNSTASGTFEEIFADGTLYGTSSATSSEIGTSTLYNVTVDETITGGTGIFADVTGGEININGISSSTTGTLNGNYTGTITTPEPSSLALMLVGIGFLPLRRKRLV